MILKKNTERVFLFYEIIQPLIVFSDSDGITKLSSRTRVFSSDAVIWLNNYLRLFSEKKFYCRILKISLLGAV